MEKSELRLWDLVVDTRRDKPGRVMGHEGPYVQLRPPGGGREWDADPGVLRRPTADERRRAQTSEAPVTRAKGVSL
ncbi:hypothetical protein [Streptomyces sp. SGAir0957]